MVMTMCTVGCREERLSLFYIVVVFPLLNETFLSFWYSLFFLSYPPFFLLYLFVNHTRRLDHFIPFPPLIVTFSFNLRCINSAYAFCSPPILFSLFKKIFTFFDQFEYSLWIYYNPSLLYNFIFFLAIIYTVRPLESFITVGLFFPARLLN